MVDNRQNNSEHTTDCLSGKLIPVRRRVNVQVSYHTGHTPGIVFLHGGLGNRFNWRSQYEFFLSQGREVLAYDLAGHGQSSPYQKYSIGRHHRDLTRLLRRYQIKVPILCCHSYGVPIGLEWARRHQVSALILIAGGTHDLAPWWEIPLIKFLAWGGKYLFYLPGVQTLSNRLSSDRSKEKLERFFAESPVPTEPHPYKALEIFWGYNFWHCDNSKGTLRDRNDRKLFIPVLVISGGQDPMFTKEMAAELANSFKYGQHFHLPEAGHLLLAEYPEQVNQKIAGFIAGI